MPNSPHFKSFIMAGFECTAAQAEDKKRLNLLAATQHAKRCEEDYRLIKARGILTVREGLSWNQIDRDTGTYKFERFEKMMAAAKETGIQQIWDLNHFDFPADLDPFSEEFVIRFRKYAEAAIKTIKKYFPEEVLYIVPLNEISFFAWIGADMGWWAPYKKGRKNGNLFKQQLVRAALAAMDAIWEIDPTVRFIHVDPFMRRSAKPPAHTKSEEHVTEFNEIIRFEAWDMLSGKTYPELGGDPKYLDIIGMNYYIHNQEWVISGENNTILHQLIDWDSSDRVSFAEMIRVAYNRYQRPILISETGSFGVNRKDWWQRTLREIHEGIESGLPIIGCCAYPVLDRPENAGFLLPNSGLWDFDMADETCQRIPHEESLQVISEYQRKFSAQTMNSV